MVKITGLWKNKSKDGTDYLAGKLGIAKLLIFKNKHKRDNKDPDYNLYIDEVKAERQQDASAPPPEEEGF